MIGFQNTELSWTTLSDVSNFRNGEKNVYFKVMMERFQLRKPPVSMSIIPPNTLYPLDWNIASVVWIVWTGFHHHFEIGKLIVLATTHALEIHY